MIRYNNKICHYIPQLVTSCQLDQTEAVPLVSLPDRTQDSFVCKLCVKLVIFNILVSYFVDPPFIHTSIRLCWTKSYLSYTSWFTWIKCFLTACFILDFLMTCWGEFSKAFKLSGCKIFLELTLTKIGHLITPDWWIQISKIMVSDCGIRNIRKMK